MDNTAEIPYLYIGLLRHGKFGLQELTKKDIGYARIEICPLEWKFIADSSVMINAVNLRFNESGCNPWDVVTDFGLWDSLTEGNLIVVSRLNELIYVDSYTSGEFKPGSLKVAIDRIIKCEN